MEKLTANKSEKGTWDIPEIEKWEVTFTRLKEMILSGVNFKFARYGDGELNCMTGRQGANCDGHEYFPDLGERLRNSFSDKVMTGVQPLMITLSNADKFYELIENKGLALYNADVLHNAMIDLQMSTLLEAIDKSGRDVVVIGPAHLRSFFFAPVSFVGIQDLNCWLMYEETKAELLKKLEGKTNAVILLCASMMSEVLIHDLVDIPHAMIYCGSVFDPFVKIKSRKYHHKLVL